MFNYYCTIRIDLESQSLIFRHLFPKYKCQSLNPEMLQVKDKQKDRKHEVLIKTGTEMEKWLNESREVCICYIKHKEGNHILLSLKDTLEDTLPI